MGAFGQSDIMPRKEKRASDKEVVSNCFHAAVKVQKENARRRSNFFHGILDLQLRQKQLSPRYHTVSIPGYEYSLRYFCKKLKKKLIFFLFF